MMPLAWNIAGVVGVLLLLLVVVLEWRKMTLMDCEEGTLALLSWIRQNPPVYLMALLIAVGVVLGVVL